MDVISKSQKKGKTAKGRPSSCPLLGLTGSSSCSTISLAARMNKGISKSFCRFLMRCTEHLLAKNCQLKTRYSSLMSEKTLEDAFYASRKAEPGKNVKNHSRNVVLGCRPRGRSSLIIPSGGAGLIGWANFRDTLSRIYAAETQLSGEPPVPVPSGGGADVRSFLHSFSSFDVCCV